MDRSQIAKRLTELGRSAGAARRLLKEIEGLDADRARNLGRLQSRMGKLEGVVESLGQAGELGQALSAWLASYKDELVALKEEQSRRFGAELARELQTRGLELSGHYPDLRAGAFTIELDLDKWTTDVAFLDFANSIHIESVALITR